MLRRATDKSRLWIGVLVGLTTSTLGCGRSETKLSRKSESQPVAQESGALAEPQPSPRPQGDAPPTPPSPSAALPAGLFAISGTALRKKISESGAKATLVNVWASWCGPCTREFPMLVSLKEGLRERGVETIFVSVDEEKSFGDALAFAQEHGQEPPLLVAEPPLSQFKRGLHPGWPGMLPATFLFDKDAKLRYFWGGPVFDHEILPVVEGLLRGENIDGETLQGLKKGVDY